jgi:two-component system, chemotaxis family, sensor kinase Cph1
MDSSKHLRQRAEKALDQSRVEYDNLVLDQQHLIHELQVHQIELEMQNEELHLAQAELETSRDRYLDLYDFAPVGYLTMSDTGLITEVNLTLACWLGPDPSEVLGRPFSDLVARGIAQDTSYLHHKTLLESGEPQRSEVHLVRPNGSRFCVRLDSTREDRSGQPRRVRTAVSDITERKQAEEALRTEHIAHVLAEQETRLKTRFLAMVSHELRTPLTSIKGFTSTLLQEDLMFELAQQYEFLDIINQETDKLVELVEQLLNLSHLQAGGLQIHCASVSLQESLTLGAAQFQALTTHHELILPNLEDLPLVIADSARIAQVSINLDGNAVKHSPSNTPIISSARQIEGFVKTSVTDQGEGIPVQDRENVFKAFEQLETMSQIKGFGLGLAVCKGLIEAHGGQIWVQDQVKPGTTISFTLPVAVSHA